MPPNQSVEQLVLVTYAIAEAANDPDPSEVLRLIELRQELLSVLVLPLDDISLAAVKKAELVAKASLLDQKAAVARLLNDMFAERRTSKAYRAAN